VSERRVRRESDVRGVSSLPRARVLETVGGVYTLELENGQRLNASLRGRLKLEQRIGDRIVVGDMVTIASGDDDSATIESVEPRSSQLARRAPGRNARKAKVIAANIEHVVIVFAAADPEPHLRMLDRFLLLAEANGLHAHIVLNKIELIDDRASLNARLAVYADHYPLLYTSVQSGEGLDAFAALVCGHESVITGPSGVGKSSLLNTLEPGLALRVGVVSEAVHKGQHTTVSARLIPLGCGGHIVDTPGLRELGLWGVDAETLDQNFPEFHTFLGTCRFANSCTHTHEPGCAVLAAVASGQISEERYHSYRDLRVEADEGM
jgi:ribosome biogenesis GTPase